MKLFAELYLDEDVSALVATLLRARGFNVTTAREQALLGRDDAEQLAHAVSLGRCIFTHNRIHFERLHVSTQPPVIASVFCEAIPEFAVWRLLRRHKTPPRNDVG
jgi:predicted nuclease of predicted toxin-antitoxin system